MSFHVVPLPVPVEPTSVDNARIVVADAHPGFPCRRCLRDAAVGERVLLLPYDPFRVASPYAGRSPIYLHEQCDPAAPAVDELPEQQRRRLLSLRAYDREALLVDAVVTDGAEAEPVVEELLARADVDHLLVHNAGPGCFAVRIDRVAART